MGRRVSQVLDKLTLTLGRHPNGGAMKEVDEYVWSTAMSLGSTDTFGCHWCEDKKDISKGELRV